MPMAGRSISRACAAVALMVVLSLLAACDSIRDLGCGTRESLCAQQCRAAEADGRAACLERCRSGNPCRGG